jgi:hypothetical protein
MMVLKTIKDAPTKPGMVGAFIMSARRQPTIGTQDGIAPKL